MSTYKVGDPVKITLRPGDVCFEYSGKAGVIESGPDSEGGYQVRTTPISATRDGLRCLPEELQLAAPRKDRDDILNTARNLINGQRAKDYGDASQNFRRIAELWEPILETGITPEQVALCLVQLKIARLITSPTHEDSWVDAAGYIALGGEIATKPA